MSEPRVNRRRIRVRTGFYGVLALAVVIVVAVHPASAATSATPGGSGTKTELPDTDSAVTVQGRGSFAGVTFQVNQTRNLVNQAVSVSWSGATPTPQDATFNNNYMQIMQCWGDPDGANPDNPGPPPEQCQFGATNGSYGYNSGLFRSQYPFPSTRIMGRSSWAMWHTYDAAQGALDPNGQYVWRKFRAVDGTEVGPQVDYSFNPLLGSGSYWLNPYFDINTTNEVPASPTSPDGRGSELFQVATGLEASGLGCGQKVQPAAGGGTKVPQCWLVIVPRGDADDENLDTSYFGDNAQTVGTSALSPQAWKNRIAIPLEFNPLDSGCSINAQSRSVVGTEMALPAVSGWQPALCATGSLPPYTYGVVPDDAARNQIGVVSPGLSSPGMAVTSQPIDPTTVSAANPVVNAPLTASGLVIGFNIERTPNPDAPAEEQKLRGVRAEDIKLTPRLVAKLLTQSYGDSIEVFGKPAPYSWVGANPGDLTKDRDFLQYNPEFSLFYVGNPKNTAGLVVSAPNSDAARMLWQWVLADPEAKAWLDGQPDQWGMRVNPVYSTTAAANSNGAPFGDPPPESFPKADPWCYQEPVLPSGLTPTPLCGNDWLPYVGSNRDSAREVRAADDRAKVVLNADARNDFEVWKRLPPQAFSKRSILSITDSASAYQYGLQTAQLSRAGDDGAERDFIAPDAAGLEKGVAAMQPSVDPTMRVADPTAPAPGAYPLTVLNYAQVRPLLLDSASRADFAALLDYAAGAGQTPGLAPGQLPMGYVPLPADLAAATAEAADSIRTMQAPPANSGTDGSGSPTSLSSSSYPNSSSRPSPSSKKTTPTTAGGEAAAAPTGAAAMGASEPAEQKLGPLTPIVALARSRFFLPVLAAVTLASGLAALEITKRPRRRRAPKGATP